MKNKIIYLFILIFSVSMISSAKKTPGVCDKMPACSNMKIQKCKEAKENEADKEAGDNFPSVGLFFLNI